MPLVKNDQVSVSAPSLSTHAMAQHALSVSNISLNKEFDSLLEKICKIYNPVMINTPENACLAGKATVGLVEFYTHNSSTCEHYKYPIVIHSTAKDELILRFAIRERLMHERSIPDHLIPDLSSFTVTTRYAVGGYHEYLVCQIAWVGQTELHVYGREDKYSNRVYRIVINFEPDAITFRVCDPFHEEDMPWGHTVCLCGNHRLRFD